MSCASVEDTLRMALDCHRSGQLSEAEARYRQVLRQQPDHPEALRLLGMLASQVNRPEIAVELIRRVIAIQPENAEAHFNLGTILQAQGQAPEALESYHHAVEVQPDHVEALCNLGNGLKAIGRVDEAIAVYRQAVQTGRAAAYIHFNLGVALQARGSVDEAIASFKMAVEGEPRNPRFHNNLGNALHLSGQLDEAALKFQNAVEIDPAFALAHFNLGNVRQAQGRMDEAIKEYRAAISIQPGDAGAYNNLGSSLQALGRVTEAIDAYREALRIEPRRLEFRNNLGNALQLDDQLDAALCEYREVLRAKPAYAAAWFNQGNVYRLQGDLDGAVTAYLRSIDLDPGHADAWNNLGNCYKELGRPEDACGCYRRALTLDEAAAAIHSNLAYNACFCSGYSPAMILAECRLWDACHGKPLSKYISSHNNGNDPDRRLRIGYVSADFRRHVVGSNLLPHFREHDRSRFELFCYSDVMRPDKFTEEFRSAADHWRPTAGLSDSEVAKMIMKDKIDILVDLTLHMFGNRLPVFGRKPAPVQVTYLGYPGTTGMDTIDYRLSDPFLDPPAADLSCYSEETVLLPRSYWCYEPLGPTPPVSALPALSQGHVTFGCLNSFSKVSPRALKLWAKLLQALPSARLALHVPAESSRAALLEQYGVQGITADRLIFVAKQSWGDYIQTWQGIDVALDPFPYCGGITTCDALWMGVPVITLSGQMAVSRGGRSILSNIGLPELIARSEREYQDLAIALAEDLPRLSYLRATLRARMEQSPLRAPRAFSRDLEEAYRIMWRRWCTESIGRSNERQPQSNESVDHEYH